MSGGVDSSVAAALLQEQGFEVIGVFLHFWHDIVNQNESLDLHIENRCCSREAEEGARKVAQKLGIKFYAINVSKEFKKAVVDYFLFEYKQGRTPNPCIECNRSIKFGIMIDKALALGADFVATGHYVRIYNCHCSVGANCIRPNERIKLLKAKDENKDQSYFLYTLTQKKLARCLFPVGNFEKKDIRVLAKKHGFEIADRKESQEICFIQGKHYGDFLRKYLKLVPGKIVDENDNILGEHKGLPLYTIGQRRDIGIGGTGPYFVLGMNRRKNQLIVSNQKNDQNLFAKKFVVEKIVWTSGIIPKLPLRMKAKIRYRMKESPATINKENGKYVIEFSKPERAIMPGQSVVFYQKDEVLGGGIIKKVLT